MYFWVDSVIGNPAYYRFPLPFFLVTSQVIVASYLLSVSLHLLIFTVCVHSAYTSTIPSIGNAQRCNNTNIIMTIHVVIKFTIEHIQ